jgi:hypothetical protein
MANMTSDALFSGAQGFGMGADMLNPGAASDSVDWGAVLANGIRGAAQGAIAASVGGAYASGQLQPMPGRDMYGNPLPVASSGANLIPLLLIGAVLFLAMRA